MTIIQKIALALTIFGGLCWALIGIFDFNIISFIFQEASFLTRTIYIIIGTCSLFSISLLSISIKKDINL